jgi:transaldolase
MVEKHILEKIAEVNPDAEIWWDSSPLVYRNWAREMVEKAPDAKREIWGTQLKRLFDPEDSGATFFRGVTTNPPLSFDAIKDDPQFWANFVKELIRANPEKGVEEIFWLTYKEVVKRGAEFFLPIWEKSDHKHGYLSGQVDPRYVFETERMFAQAMDLSQLSPNVMIKCPGSREGYELIRRLTALGIATNNTLAFSVPQFIACMEAVQEGLKIARENPVWNPGRPQEPSGIPRYRAERSRCAVGRVVHLQKGIWDIAGEGISQQDAHVQHEGQPSH